MFDTIDRAKTDFGWVPSSLEEMPPGCGLGATLEGIHIDACSPYDRVRILKAYDRLATHYQAMRYRLIAAILESMAADPDEAEFAVEAASAEIAAALRLTRRAADAETAFALDLHRRLPLVWRALLEGTIDVRRARVIVNTTSHLAPGAARDVVDHIINDAPLLTTGQLGAKLRKLCTDIDPKDAKDRYQHALDGRRVVVEANTTGTANLLLLDVAPDRAVALMNRVNRAAKQPSGPDETRTMDQRRADTLLDIFEGNTTNRSRSRGGVDIPIDLASLAGLCDHLFTSTTGHTYTTTGRSP